MNHLQTFHSFQPSLPLIFSCLTQVKAQLFPSVFFPHTVRTYGLLMPALRFLLVTNWMAIFLAALASLAMYRDLAQLPLPGSSKFLDLHLDWFHLALNGLVDSVHPMQVSANFQVSVWANRSVIFSGVMVTASASLSHSRVPGKIRKYYQVTLGI